MPIPSFASSYLRTQQGNQELESRTLKLHPRQRALLRMIEANLSNTLSRQQFEQLATAENLDILLHYQLIIRQESALIPELTEQVGTPINPMHSVLPVTISTVISSDIPETQPTDYDLDQPVSLLHPGLLPADAITTQSAQPVPVHAVAPQPISVEILDFDGVKQLMSITLKEYCGLMASQLIRDIQQATSPARLRMCQIHWITTLTESRAESQRIALWHQQVSQSLSC